MSALSRLPILGILNGDAPSAQMLVVAFKHDVVKWAYATPGHLAHPRSYELTHPESFTPLSAFGIGCHMMPEGMLAVFARGEISIAKYPDGKSRNWQGATLAKVRLNPRFGGYVVEAVRLDFERVEDAKVSAGAA